MRGKQNLLTATYSENRITPAGAGKTGGKDRSGVSNADHPRRCGENRASMDPFTANNGSPPQVRGKHDTIVPAVRQYRITPAGAGKTGSRPHAAAHRTDHPRRCGENQLYIVKNDQYLGSPPQVRGKLLGKLGTLFALRITPAGAGKTIPYRFLCWENADHPRRCGENFCTFRLLPAVSGSPPQVRGKLYCFACGAGGDGITPAGAGKTYRQHEHVETAEDHPRRCGENTLAVLIAHLEPGSPPQVRGKRKPLPLRRAAGRITPAGAGKTFFNDIGKIGNTDHPRRCGENYRCLPAERDSLGSPPQVRGKPSTARHGKRIARITPAGAGKTVQIAMTFG